MLFVLNLQELDPPENMDFDETVGDGLDSDTSLMLCSLCCSSMSLLAC